MIYFSLHGVKIWFVPDESLCFDQSDGCNKVWNVSSLLFISSGVENWVMPNYINTHNNRYTYHTYSCETFYYHVDMYMVVIISYTYVFFNRAVLIYGNKFMLLLISMLVQEELGCLSGNGSAELYGATVLCLLYVNIIIRIVNSWVVCTIGLDTRLEY